MPNNFISNGHAFHVFKLPALNSCKFSTSCKLNTSSYLNLAVVTLLSFRKVHRPKVLSRGIGNLFWERVLS